jgi:hypothetical protein
MKPCEESSFVCEKDLWFDLNWHFSLLHHTSNRSEWTRCLKGIASILCSSSTKNLGEESLLFLLLGALSEKRLCSLSWSLKLEVTENKREEYNCECHPAHINNSSIWFQFGDDYCLWLDSIDE